MFLLWVGVCFFYAARQGWAAVGAGAKQHVFRARGGCESSGSGVEVLVKKIIIPPRAAAVAPIGARADYLPDIAH